MSKKIISAIGSDVIEKLLKEMLPEYEIADDIPYQEGLFDILFTKRRDNNYKRANTTQYYTPSYSTYINHNVYDSDAVQQAIRCIVQEIKKLEPRHIVRDKGRKKVVYDDIQAALDYPNELMTTPDFLEKIIYNLFVYYNSYILPVWENGELTALYPLQPTHVDFLQDASNTLFIKLTFANGYESTIRYRDIIHIRYNFGASEYLGGDIEGKPDIKALQKGVNLNESLLNGVEKSIKSSYAVNGVVKYNTMIDDGKTDKELARLTEKLNNNENGFMSLDLKGEFIPFKRDVQIVDEATLKFVDEKVLRNWGVSKSIITGDYTPEQYAAFYQKVLEPIVITMNAAFTKALFTKKGITEFGHKVVFYTSELNFMSMTDKKDIADLLSTTGSICVDELRDLFGFVPCDDEVLGKTMVMSKNFGDALSVKDQVKDEVDAIKSLAKDTNNTN